MDQFPSRERLAGLRNWNRSIDGEPIHDKLQRPLSEFLLQRGRWWLYFLRSRNYRSSGRKDEHQQ